jgi:hypothetical protein
MAGYPAKGRIEKVNDAPLHKGGAIIDTPQHPLYTQTTTDQAG